MTFDSLQKSIDDFLSNDTLPPVVLCIGTDLVVGDAFGPLVGDILTRRFNLPAFVYGTLALPVTAVTLPSVVDFIEARHEGQKIIAVDSGLGAARDVGRISARRGGVKPGLATGKKLPEIGDFSVIATVGVLGESNALSSVRLGFVSALAEVAASAINGAIAARFGSPRRRHAAGENSAKTELSPHYPLSVNNNKSFY